MIKSGTKYEDMKIFDEAIKTLLESTKTENKVCYLMDDYNIDLLNIESHGPTSDYNDTMYSMVLFL